MIQRKTATLLAASAQLGAVVTADHPTQIAGLYRFGESLGMAFQIQDDILGIWGDEQVTGKSAATDIRDRKKTLPVVYALSHAPRLAALYGSTTPTGKTDVQAILDILEEIGARAFADAMAEGYFRRALESLEASDFDPAAQAPLRELAASLLQRKA